MATLILVATCLATAMPPAVAQAGNVGAAASAAVAGRFDDFRLETPASQPQSASEPDDFPYLVPLPGSVARTTERGTQGLDVTTPDDDEPHIVGTRTITRTYGKPPGLADEAWLRVYVRALRDAGWTIMSQGRQANEGAHLVSHYAAAGRDLWARLIATPGQYSVTVADVGDDLGHLLARECRVTVYGIEFVLDRPDLDGPAEPILMELRQLLRADRSMRLQVVVHLDRNDVPGNPAGAKRLSQQRAEAIRVWLARHRVDIDRVTAVGAGADQPLQPSATEEQRTRNRRVELVREGCR